MASLASSAAAHKWRGISGCTRRAATKLAPTWERPNAHCHCVPTVRRGNNGTDSTRLCAVRRQWRLETPSSTAWRHLSRPCGRTVPHTTAHPVFRRPPRVGEVRQSAEGSLPLLLLPVLPVLPVPTVQYWYPRSSPCSPRRSSARWPSSCTVAIVRTWSSRHRGPAAHAPREGTRTGPLSPLSLQPVQDSQSLPHSGTLGPTAVAELQLKGTRFHIFGVQHIVVCEKRIRVWLPR